MSFLSSNLPYPWTRRLLNKIAALRAQPGKRSGVVRDRNQTNVLSLAAHRQQAGINLIKRAVFPHYVGAGRLASNYIISDTALSSASDEGAGCCGRPGYYAFKEGIDNLKGIIDLQGFSGEASKEEMQLAESELADLASILVGLEIDAAQKIEAVEGNVEMAYALLEALSKQEVAIQNAIANITGDPLLNKALCSSWQQLMTKLENAQRERISTAPTPYLV